VPEGQLSRAQQPRLRCPIGAVRWLRYALALGAVMAAQAARTAHAAPAAQIAPFPGYTLRDEQRRDRFLVQRWVSADSPEVSPAGVCDCIVNVYVGNRLVLKFGTPGDISAITIDEATGGDLDSDGHTDLVVSTWSGGMHCCYSVRAYSIARKVRTLLSLDTGDCGPGEFSDLDHDGVSEFLSCDGSWKDRYCSFALAPFPTVVYAYDAAQRRYRIATPKYARHFDVEIATERAEAERQIQQGAPADAGDTKCAVLHPALGLIYTGRLAEGLGLISRLYHGADLDMFLKETEAAVRASPLWVP
jgi:hypothetical protein